MKQHQQVGIWMAAAWIALPATVFAANPDFQTAVTAAENGICTSLGGASPVCGASDLSGASESSLAPTQALAHGEGELAKARELANRAEGEGGGKLDIGPFSLLFNGRASTFERDADALERGYDGGSAGMQLGLDKRLSERTVLGGFLAFERSEADFDGDPAGLNPAASEGSTETDTWSLIVFAAHALSDTLNLEATAGYGRSDYSFQRNTYYEDALDPMRFFQVVTRGDSKGQNTWLSMGMTYALGQGALALDPYARLTWARSEIDAYSETEITATGLNMRYADSDRSSLTSVLGLHVGMTQSMSWGVLVPYFRLEYEHEFLNDPQDVQSFFVLDGANTLFAPRGREPDRDYFNLSAGAQFVYPNGWLGFIEIEALMGHRDLERSRLLLGLRKEL